MGGDFEAALEQLVGTLSAVLRVERLGTAEGVRYLYRCLTFRRHPVRVPEREPYTLEQLLGAGDLFGGSERFGETWIVPIRFTGFPDRVGPAGLDFLNDLPLPFQATFRFLALDPFTARRAIRRRRARWNTAGIGLRQGLAVLFGGSGAKPAFTERFGPRMAADADDALLELEMEESSAGYLTATFFTASEDREEAVSATARLVKHLRNEGYPAAATSVSGSSGCRSSATAVLRSELLHLPPPVGGGLSGVLAAVGFIGGSRSSTAILARPSPPCPRCPTDHPADWRGERRSSPPEPAPRRTPLSRLDRTAPGDALNSA